jgi:hypothetical protein
MVSLSGVDGREGVDSFSAKVFRWKKRVKNDKNGDENDDDIVAIRKQSQNGRNPPYPLLCSAS